MSVIKQISIFNGSNWDTPADIGANAENIDFTYTTGSQQGNTAALSSILPAQALTASRVLVTDSNGKLSSSSISSGILNTALSGASTTTSLQSQINTLNTNLVHKDGSVPLTGNLSMTPNSNLDLTKTNNGLTSTLYSTSFQILDKNGKTAARLEGIIGQNGYVGSQWYIRNYDTSGNIISGDQKGIKMGIYKDGTFVYNISLPDSFIDALKFLPGLIVDSITSVTTYNCTGTISNLFYMNPSENKKNLLVSGRVRITNFVRTNSNPGVSFKLPFTPIETRNMDIGFCAEKPNLLVTLRLTKNSTTGQLIVTETFANATNGTLSFVCPQKIVRIAV